MKSKIAAGILGLVAFGVGAASCARSNPKQSARDGGRGRRPQTAYLRGSKLDAPKNPGYLYFYGSAKDGKVSPTEADGTTPTTGGRLVAGGDNGLPTGKILWINESERKGDLCVKDVPTYVLHQDGPTGPSVCGHAGDNDRENTYDPTPYDIEKCGTPEKHQEMVYRAIAVPGYWNDQGLHEPLGPGGKTVFTMGCINASIAKCVHWGYVPWSTEKDLTKHHQACVHAALANYRGLGARTCGHTVVDFFDNIDVQGIDKVSKPEEFEAAWGPTGAVCVKQTRYAACQAEITPPLYQENCAEYCPEVGSWKPDALLCTRSEPNQFTNDKEKCPGYGPGLVPPKDLCW